MTQDGTDRWLAHDEASDEPTSWWVRKSQLIQAPATRFLGEACYPSLVQDMNYHDKECMKLALSKVLGAGMVVGGAIIKIPQILLILKHRSVQGLSPLSFFLETCAYVIVLVYNVRHGNPFNTYGEVFFMTLQNIVISYMLFHYHHHNSLVDKEKKRGGHPTATATAAAAAAAATFLWVMPDGCMSFCFAAQIPIGLASKIPQMRENHKHQSTGQLSVFAVLSSFFGTVARVFTTWTEIHDDVVMLGGNLIASLLNGVLVLQMAMYWRNTQSKVAMQQKLQ
ncbi:hypothetical protein BDF20DRAFT_812141 [Mycotypha africana]|uniref:uncharacterized protein n=1 Tax=Mycotypha africana TaxID=64632 RepID=UPI002300487F|nr:uncharacterized protein BDF20DRAFT_812141 [Mycotypha africana]KAI8991172.1 hypothetical protein BDF20DRAFT_812141 [Mycotypha africana]